MSHGQACGILVIKPIHLYNDGSWFHYIINVIVRFKSLSMTLYQINFYKWSNGNRTWWRHQMETFSVLLALCEGKSPVTGEFPSSRPVTRRFDFFMCTWTNGWVNNRDAAGLRYHRTRYDATVMDIENCGRSPFIAVNCECVLKSRSFYPWKLPFLDALYTLQWRHITTMASKITSNSTIYSTFCSS